MQILNELYNYSWGRRSALLFKHNIGLLGETKVLWNHPEKNCEPAGDGATWDLLWAFKAAEGQTFELPWGAFTPAPVWGLKSPDLVLQPTKCLSSVVTTLMWPY